MKAFVYEGKGKTVIREVKKPYLPQGGLIAEVLYASICGTDLRTYKYGNEKLIVPRIIGHEACYRVEQVSKDLSGIQSGDRVIIAPAIGCGECLSCRRGHTNMCSSLKTIGFEYDGTFADYCAIPQQAIKMENVIHVPDSVETTDACLAEPIACAINGQSFLNIKKGENILIFGAGFLGCIHAELALIKDANNVIIAEISEKRRNQALKIIPNIKVVDSSDPYFIDNLKKIAGPNGIDVIITACPVGILHKTALELINNNGRISLFGGLPGEENFFLDSNLIHYKEVGVFGVHASTVKQNIEALNLIKEKKINVSKYLKQFKLDNIEFAFQSLIDNTATKILLKMKR